MAYKKSLFIFRRDLRIFDNTALLQACRNSRKVIVGFVFDPDLLARSHNGPSYRTGFLLDSLRDLNRQVRACGGELSFFHGEPVEVIARMVTDEGIDAVYINRDYTPLARRRDERIRRLCRQRDVAFVSCEDALLNPPEAVSRADGNPYQVFTPWFNVAKKLSVPAPDESMPDNLLTRRIGDSWTAARKPRAMQGDFSGGRRAALELLSRAGSLKNYGDERDIPAVEGTSRLAAHLRFGTISMREARHHLVKLLGEEHELIRQLYWRDFWYHIAWHFPHVFGGAFRRRYDQIPWIDDDLRFESWCEGKTGFPLVDAGMRELVATGYMHNRVRMVTASFLVKNLHIDWRRGEAFFARHLIDYDPAVNNGNWQWAASTGCDAQPWFRVFNPWRQQRRFDPEGEYIRRWVHELADRSPAAIHRLERDPTGYISPVVDLQLSAEEIKAKFRSLSPSA
ncbi:MAG: deoxyribodipyrimidine photo-lyase [Pseudomonadales bacterium]|nr:deoxyribodipyrimidine photo-lyase [Pseudomonadales bacterium]